MHGVTPNDFENTVSPKPLRHPHVIAHNPGLSRAPHTHCVQVTQERCGGVVASTKGVRDGEFRHCPHCKECPSKRCAEGRAVLYRFLKVNSGMDQRTAVEWMRGLSKEYKAALRQAFKRPLLPA